MLASKLLRRNDNPHSLVELVNRFMLDLRERYKRVIGWCLKHQKIILGLFALLIGLTLWLGQKIPTEYAPREDRGAFFVIVNGPEGASYSYMEAYMNEIEKRMMSYVESGEITRLMVRAPRSFGTIESFNSGMVIVVLNDWGARRNAFVVMDEIRKKLADLPGVTVSLIMRQGFASQTQKPVQFVLGGGTYEELAQWRDILLKKLEQHNPGLLGIDWDYKETKPQVEVQIDSNRAADLGVSVNNIGRTLETLLGSRRATTYIDDGEEYDVILQGERDQQRTTTSLQNMYVRSERSGELIPLANLVQLKELADASKLNRYNRIRSLTLEANLADNLALGDALAYLNQLVKDNLPPTAVVDYKGLSRDFKNAGSSVIFIFVLGIAITFLVLAAQFESFIHPLVIMLTVPLAILGGLLGLFVTGSSLNLYSQIGLIMLIGLAAKNGILIVEFSNQLRDRGVEFTQALLEASAARLRPILMTSLTAAAGAMPLVISSGAGAETRFVIGTVVIAGVLIATLFTLFIVPVAYSLLARNTGSPGDVARALAQEQRDYSGAEPTQQAKSNRV